MKILNSESALENISNIAKFTSNISTKYTNKIVSALYSYIDTLKYAPYSGRYVPEVMDKHFREILYNEYRIMY